MNILIENFFNFPKILFLFLCYIAYNNLLRIISLETHFFLFPQLTHSRGLNERKSGGLATSQFFKRMTFRSMARFNASARRRTFPRTFLKREDQIGFITDTKTLVSLNHGGHPCFAPSPRFPRYVLKDVHVHHWGNAPLSNWDLVAALRSFNFQIYARWIYDTPLLTPFLILISDLIVIGLCAWFVESIFVIEGVWTANFSTQSFFITLIPFKVSHLI